MCKKLLQGLGLMDRDAPAPPAPSAKGEANYSGGKEGEVLGAAADTSAVASAAGGTGPMRLGGGLLDERKRKRGVPGLGL